MSETYRRALAAAVEAAAAAAELLRAECARPGGPRGQYGHCPADTEAEQLIRSRLAAAFPDWGYRGEETGAQPPAPGESHWWVVDPNDGTQAMLQGFRGHAVAIALLDGGRPVLGVVESVDCPDDAGDRFAWAEGCGPLRRNGQPVERPPWPAALAGEHVVLVAHGADRHPSGNLRCVAPARYWAMPSLAYRLALVAAGEAEATVSLTGPSAWDYAAGHALLRAVGGDLVDERGGPVRYTPDGQSRTRRCFGGAPAIVRVLVGRPWHETPGSGYGEAAPPPGDEPARLQPGRLVHDVGLLRRAQGCLLGQVAGDSLGSLVEFGDPERIARQYPDGPRRLQDGGPWKTIAGQPTDDSELALALARTLVRTGRFDPEAVAVAYARWRHGWVHGAGPEPCGHPFCRPFDVGGTIGAALGAIGPEHVRAGRAAQAAMEAARRESQANGALMRCSPIAIWGWNRPPAEVDAAARADARLTHPHPVCQAASAAFCVAVAHAIRSGAGPEETHARALEWARQDGDAPEVAEAIARAAEAPPADFLTQAGWVLVALQNAFYRLLHAPSFEDGLVATVRAGGDADTNAAIAGALLGAVHGRAAIPAQWRRMVLTCRPMPGHPGVRQPRPALFWPADALALAERLLLA